MLWVYIAVDTKADVQVKNEKVGSPEAKHKEKRPPDCSKLVAPSPVFQGQIEESPQGKDLGGSKGHFS